MYLGGAEERTYRGMMMDQGREGKREKGEQGKIAQDGWQSGIGSGKCVEVQRYPGGMYLERLIRKLITA
jgi:hypothetical protein